MLELQDKLRKSEDERMKLEEKFNILSQDSRSRREACINNLRMRYIDFLEEQRLRDERNHQILGALDKIDGSLARMTARTDRLGILRKQYEAYLLRLYANRRSGGGTGDSGVGSQNEDRSSKANILGTEKTAVLKHNAGTSSNFIPPTNYPQSHIPSSNISQFNLPLHVPGPETISKVEILQVHGQGDGPTQPQLFCGSHNLNSTPRSLLEPNASQEFGSYPLQFLRSSRHPVPSTQMLVGRNNLENTSSLYATDPSIMRSRILADPTGVVTSDLHPDRTNSRIVASEFSADLNQENFGPYRHSTPLPGYLDYSTRYSREPSGYAPDSNVAADLHSGFTRADLKNVIQRNEQILPRDYLHNPETIRPITRVLKSSFTTLDNKQKPPDAKPSGSMNSDELDRYINRIRSLHRENEHNLDALDVEQNTSGDLLDATLSDDGPEPLPLHSDDKTRASKVRTLSEDVRAVLALADDFVAETSNWDNESLGCNEPSGDHEAPAQIRSQGVTIPTLPEPAVSKTTTGKPSISVTRDDILSGSISHGVKRLQDTSVNVDDKFSTKVAPPIANLDSSRLNIKHVATVSRNSTVNPDELLPNECASEPVPSNSSSEYNKIDGPQLAQEISPAMVQSALGSVPQKPGGAELHEDIEGDKVSLVPEEKALEDTVDLVRELQPPSLQHHEKNVVRIRHAEEDNRGTDSMRAVVSKDPITSDKTEEDDDESVNRIRNSAQNSIINNIGEHPSSEKIAADQKLDASIADAPNPQYENVGETEYEHLDQEQYHQHLPAEYLEQHHNPEEEYQQSSEQLYDAGVRQQLGYDTRQTEDEATAQQQGYVTDNEPDQVYEANQAYDPNQQYAVDLNQHYPGEADQRSDYDPNQHFENRANLQYPTDPKEHYGADSNQHYEGDPNVQYTAESDQHYGSYPNAQYVGESDQHYAVDPNAQYATDPNEQYEYYQDQPYQEDPNATYDHVDNEQYNYAGEESYRTDPNMLYENDPNQGSVEHDPNQGYEHDPNQEYQHNTDEFYAVQDPDHVYEESKHEGNQIYGEADYVDPQQGREERFESDVQYEQENDSMDLQICDKNYVTVTADDGSEMKATTGDSNLQEVSNLADTKASEDSAEERKKDKDVIRALLESDTDSTIERNPSNNTESDFDFN